MWLQIFVSVDWSKQPMAMAIVSWWIGSQNRKEPQVSQKPRRTFSEDWYQRIWSSPMMVTALVGTSAEAQ